ncbi:MAG: NADH-quinone oxidoreductase subunit C [Gammaproteobacteria bacterium]|nr:NADH-quinone oxidoreductase subunit C [Gammaproteobacteria bacterium]
MQLEEFPIQLSKIPGAVAAWQGMVNAEQWRSIFEKIHTAGGRLLALWGSDERERGEGYTVHAALTVHSGLVCLHLDAEEQRPMFPDISELFPSAKRMQRALHDMLGLRPGGAADHRKWLRHGAWPGNRYPLRKDFAPAEHFAPENDNYPFITVTGEGVHEIPVGPVHAGIIEPGHFRFQIVGEKILRLEQRLGYAHKGIEKLFESMTQREAAKLAGRISGDSTVAYAWAYAMALEGACQVAPPARALWLRALLLERERIMNHLGDLGALGNDAGFAFGLAQFSRLKEEVLRTNRALFGHRYLMDAVIPGGVAHDLDAAAKGPLLNEIQRLQDAVTVLKNIYDDHAGVQDRFLTTGRVAPELAARLGLTGFAGRASGQAWDMRVQFPCAPYDQLEVRMVTHRNGDVAARVTVRFEEIFESLRLCRTLLEQLPEGATIADLPAAPEGAFGVGWVEGWRGEILVALSTGKDHGIRRVHAHDPSWQNWPALEYAVIGNIVPDFPLINKSFNLSYSGHDL